MWQSISDYFFFCTTEITRVAIRVSWLNWSLLALLHVTVEKHTRTQKARCHPLLSRRQLKTLSLSFLSLPPLAALRWFPLLAGASHLRARWREWGTAGGGIPLCLFHPFRKIAEDELEYARFLLTIQEMIHWLEGVVHVSTSIIASNVVAAAAIGWDTTITTVGCIPTGIGLNLNNLA